MWSAGNPVVSAARQLHRRGTSRGRGKFLSYDRQLFEALRSMRAWTPGDLVLDVGANDGRTVKRLMHYLPKPRVIAFEPVSSTFATLQRTATSYPDVECAQLALGSEPGERTIYLQPLAALNSLDENWGTPIGQETIPMETLDRFVSARALSQINLLKIDVEGHDLEVLKGGRETLQSGRVDIVMVEAGFDAPGRSGASLEQIRTYLAPLGYYLYGVYNQCRGPVQKTTDPRAERGPSILVYCDALFVRGQS